MFMSAFGANTTLGQYNIRRYWPQGLRFDSIRDSNEGQMGADVLAGSVLYMIAMYHRLWMPCLLFAMFDCAYYGPQALAAPISAGVTAFALL